MLDLIPTQTKLELAFEPILNETIEKMEYHRQLEDEYFDDFSVPKAQLIYHFNRRRSLNKKASKIQSFLNNNK